jgi:hypothetical protein
VSDGGSVRGLRQGTCLRKGAGNLPRVLKAWLPEDGLVGRMQPRLPNLLLRGGDHCVRHTAGIEYLAS